jgi:hypothetical protein
MLRGMAAYREGEPMAGKQTWLEQNRIRLGLAGLLAVGTLGVTTFGGSTTFWKEWLAHVFMAVAISGVIALFIEFTLHQQIAKDVFEAAVGYFLPDELRDELRWICGAKFMCMKHTHTVRLKRIQDKNLLSVESEIVRVFKNITSENQEFKPGLGVWERFNDGLPSKILSYTCHPEDGERGENLALVSKPRPEKGPVIGIGEQAPIRVSSGKHITISMLIQETLGENDWAYAHFGNPTKDVTVVVEHPEGWMVDVRFSHRDSDPQVDKVGSHTWHLKGALLPLQGIRIYWFRTDKYDQWKASFA